MLRQINELVDFSFVYDELKEHYYLDNGRNAIELIRMFKYLLLKAIFELSDVDIVERSKYDMSFKYFLDMAPEDAVIEPRSLNKFRKLRRAVYKVDESLKSKFPVKNTTDVLEDEIGYCQQLIIVLESEGGICQLPKVQEPLNLLKKTVADDLEQLRISADQDARVGHKSANSSFFGYKTHIAMTEERLITAAIVTTGEKNDGKQLQTLIEKSKIAGVNVKMVIGDTAYSEKENIKYSSDNDIELVAKLNPLITRGSRIRTKPRI